MEEASNVIPFPLFNPRANVKDAADVEAVMYNAHLAHVDDAVDFMLPLIFTHLSQAGFDFDEGSSNPDIETQDTKNVAFFIEALRAMLSSKYGIDHPFQELAAASFENHKEGGVIMTKSVNVTFKDAEEA